LISIFYLAKILFNKLNYTLVLVKDGTYVASSSGIMLSENGTLPMLDFAGAFIESSSVESVPTC
jgi:hypothetical protein